MTTDEQNPGTDPGDCEFCQGIAAHQRGEPVDANPYPPGEVATAVHPHSLWRWGWQSEELV